MKIKPKYSPIEEKTHYISHILGAVLALLFGIIILTNTSSTLEFFSALFFIITMLIMYLTSTFYHYFEEIKIKTLFKKFDHAAIFLFIFGTYVPYCLVAVQTKSAFILIFFLGLLTLIGMIFKIFFAGRFKLISTFIFLCMGWSCVFILGDIIANLTTIELFLLALGGIFYTIGAVFYALAKFKYHHLVWHIFIILAATCHTFSIYLLIRNN